VVGILEVAVAAFQTVMSPNLLLKCGKFSRPSGQWQDETAKRFTRKRHRLISDGREER
jgi:hypothetical protein